MKKMFLLSIVLVLACGAALAQKINLLQPNGGEILTLGAPQLISWTYSGMTGNETILIALEGLIDYGPIAYGKLNQGSLEWQVGKKMTGGFALPANDYRIIIEVQENDSVYDISENPFTIVVAEGSISLLNPSGGESIESGAYFDINWAYAGKSGLVKLTLLKDEQPLGLIADNIPAVSFRYRWHIGDPLLNGIIHGTGGNFRIQIDWKKDAQIEKSGHEERPNRGIATSGMQKNSDRSKGVFSIKEMTRQDAKIEK